jgi:[ribosomal protein S5]-alanine N-acetyltransferase
MRLKAAPEVIETARLLLRRPKPGDAGPIFERYASVQEVTRYLAWPRHQSIADTEAFIDFSDLEWRLQGCGPYLVLARDSSALLGATGLSIAGHEAETGYVFARDAWGHGYATESLKAMVDVARSIGLRTLHAQCHPDHSASIHVLEKCGFTLEHRSPAAHVFPNLGPSKQDVLSYICDLRLGVGPGFSRASRHVR